MLHITLVVVLLMGSLSARTARAQSSESFGRLLTPGVRKGILAEPKHLKDFVKDGALNLSLHDAILLTLENNSTIRINETQIESRKFAVLNAHAPFDPTLQSILNINRYSFPGYSQLQGVGASSSATLNSLTQNGQINYIETFKTGTNVLVGLSSTKNSSNSSFFYFNPYFNTSLNLQFTQPLLRNFGFFPNTAPILIARRTLDQSRASFQAQVSNAILLAIQAYWTAVQARGTLQVTQESLGLAESSYNRDKRALELGALGPLDIYRSQSQMAARRVQLIQSELAVTQADDALRLTIGANQDPQIRILSLKLTEKPEPGDTSQPVNEEAVLDEAIRRRPELKASEFALDADRTNIRLAHNQLRPDLSLMGFYQTNGLGGNQYDLTTGKLIASGGFQSSFGQLFGFTNPGYGGTLTLNLPLRKRAAQATLGTALVAQTQDLYTAREAKEEVTRQVSDAVRQLAEAKLALDASMTSLDLAQKSLAADQRKFELGTETNFFVLDSQAKVADSRLALLQAQINYQLANAALDHASGNMLAPYRVQIDDLSK